jgi:hypothetical protein
MLYNLCNIFPENLTVKVQFIRFALFTARRISVSLLDVRFFVLLFVKDIRLCCWLYVVSLSALVWMFLRRCGGWV